MRKSRLRLLKRLKRFLNPVAFALILTILVYVIVRVFPSDKFDTINEHWLLMGVFVAYLVLGLLFNRVNKTRLLTRPVSISTPEALATKLYALSRILEDTGRSLRGIEEEILACESVGKELAEKAQEIRSTAEVRKDDARKIGEFLAQKIEERLREMVRASRKTSWISFASGVIASVPIGIFINTYW